MAEEETFLSNWLFAKFILPFILVWFILFAILEKTKIFGDKAKQLNAIISAVISLIFVGAVYPKIVVGNMVLFLAVAVVIVFVALLIWGFIFGNIAGSGDKGHALDKWLKLGLAIAATIAFIWAIIWSTGLNEKFFSFFSGSSLGSTIITNGVFVLVIAGALALILWGTKKKD